MRSRLSTASFATGCRIDIRTLDGERLLASTVLEDNLLALLCHSDQPQVVVQRLLQRIRALPSPARDDAAMALLILADLRRLRALVLSEVSTSNGFYARP